MQGHLGERKLTFGFTICATRRTTTSGYSVEWSLRRIPNRRSYILRGCPQLRQLRQLQSYQPVRNRVWHIPIRCTPSIETRHFPNGRSPILYNTHPTNACDRMRHDSGVNPTYYIPSYRHEKESNIATDVLIHSMTVASHPILIRLPLHHFLRRRCHPSPPLPQHQSSLLAPRSSPVCSPIPVFVLSQQTSSTAGQNSSSLRRHETTWHAGWHR